MGGSLALALKTRGAVKAIFGLDRDPATRDAAAPYLDRVTADLAEAVTEADLVILAAPVQAILQLLPAVAAHMRGLAGTLGETSDTALLAGEIVR